LRRLACDCAYSDASDSALYLKTPVALIIYCVTISNLAIIPSPTLITITHDSITCNETIINERVSFDWDDLALR
jgi:hypothetical protein